MTLPAPGWYPDAGGVTRWWDGRQWTADVLPSASAPAPAASAIPRVPDGTPVYTRWIWWVVALPFVVAIPTIGYLIDMQTRFADFLRWSISMTDSAGVADPTFAAEMLRRELALVFSPWYVALIVVSLACTGLMIWFAYLDYRDLGRLGYAKPFHWAFAFFVFATPGSLVYVIGRSVVVHRRSGRGFAPMWVSIGLTVAAFVVLVIWAVWFTTALTQQLLDILPSTLS